jgi:hypothetical protein
MSTVITSGNRIFLDAVAGGARVTHQAVVATHLIDHCQAERPGREGARDGILEYGEAQYRSVDWAAPGSRPQ